MIASYSYCIVWLSRKVWRWLELWTRRLVCHNADGPRRLVYGACMECSRGALGGQIWLCAKQLSTACKVKLRHYKYLFNCLQNHRNWVSNICLLLLLMNPTTPIHLVTNYPIFFLWNQMSVWIISQLAIFVEHKSMTYERLAYSSFMPFQFRFDHPLCHKSICL